ncbi:MAG TPA: O-antigen ligase family protein [Verrucomicrobiae bacterium]|nr:O-antigen ligase family protein [Verrucomicrobiae bacterium]
MGFFLVCLYVAVLLLRPQEWYEPVKGYELVNVIAIPTILIAFIEQSKARLGNFFVRSRFSQAMLALFASVMLSQLVRLRLSGAIDAVREFGKIAVLFYLVAILVNTPRRVRIMMWVIIVSSMVLAYNTYLEVQTGHGFGGVEPYGSYDLGTFRVIGSGIFSDPNDFAMLYLMAMPFAFALLAAGGSVPGKLLLMCSLPPMLYVLYYTQSRGGVIGFCAMIIAYFWTTTKNIIIRVSLVVVLLSAIAVFGPERARGAYVEGSASGRIMEWGLGIQMLKENPLFGFGYQRWLDYSGGMAAHNSMVNCFAELGLVGYVCWFTLCLLVMKSVSRIARAEGQVDVRIRRVANGLFAAQVGYLTAAFFLTRTYNPVLFFLLGMGFGLIRWIEGRQPAPSTLTQISTRDLARCAIYAVASVPAIWLIIRMYSAVSGAG